MLLKWGIAAAGKISNDFVTALKALPLTEHKVVAIASRSQSNSDKFAKTHGIPNAYEGYDKLAKDENVNIVYVGVLNPQHYEVVKLMLENGKHVLCEKPFTMNEKQTRKLLDISKEKNLFLMEAVWSRFFPAYDKMIEVIKSGEIGEVVQVTVEFGVPISHVDRIKNKDLGGGVILDLGVYILQFQQYVFNGLKPTKVVASGHLNEEGIDSSVAAILTFPEGKTAVLSASSFTKLACEGVVYGTKGCIKMPKFWCPTTLEVNGVVIEFPLIKNEGEFNYLNSAGLAYEAEEARQCIMKNKIESSKITHDNTLELAQLMDKLRAELGVVFPADGESY
ncbi:trans-1,2-dihydrobenzene-1,2-diol dehydrogenase-like [Diabrotica virgifera virgifera]|uniref:Trans-1,2-dihydrobenzene-1,2-diol dehydrogenase n=1 Tax=Diabrotica virgifera virgifera TaxID=50390 RepID=A0A6P7H6F5_DIAVI|nr:trans-1,2-dihydrobenzene-1,2-diol dehydrogenase-like [Diabrotica virgifera virgifera]